jgi:hypothetical protein
MYSARTQKNNISGHLGRKMFYNKGNGVIKEAIT